MIREKKVFKSRDRDFDLAFLRVENLDLLCVVMAILDCFDNPLIQLTRSYTIALLRRCLMLRIHCSEVGAKTRWRCVLVVLCAYIKPPNTWDAMADITPVSTKQARHGEVSACCAAHGLRRKSCSRRTLHRMRSSGESACYAYEFLAITPRQSAE